jgi:lipoic acid synthetase
VLAHNLETVERLTPTVRDRRATYRQSLDVLTQMKKLKPDQWTKSSIMVGLGENGDELRQSYRDLREAGVDFLTIGQYLQPSQKHLNVLEFYSPQQFDEMKEDALSYGFRYVASGPLVRSSYRAGEFFIRSMIQKEGERSAWHN